MNEQIEILKSIYSRPNELIYNEQTNTIVYNAYDDNLQTIAFSVHIYSNQIINVQSQLLNQNELKQLEKQISSNKDLYELFTSLKEFYDDLIIKRINNVKEINEINSVILMKIDHMRSPNIYMKHLRQWTNELNITGRIWIISHEIYLLIEGKKEQLKKFLIRLKTETVDIDSRGRPCKERLISQLIEYDQSSTKFNNFEKLEFTQTNDLLEYLKKFHYENLAVYMKILPRDNHSINK